MAENQNADREISLSRVLNAPVEQVWRAMTDPQHVHRWWGPKGFSTTMEMMDFRVGGQWVHVMHGPDGANYPNKSVFREIVKHKKVVYSHAGGTDDKREGSSFEASWEFEPVGDKTKVTLKMVFATKEQRDYTEKTFKAIEGGNQSLDKLSQYVVKLN